MTDDQNNPPRYDTIGAPVMHGAGTAELSTAGGLRSLTAADEAAVADIVRKVLEAAFAPYGVARETVAEIASEVFRKMTKPAAPSAPPKASVARSVHYNETADGPPLAAVVAVAYGTSDDAVELYVFNPRWASPGLVKNVPFSEKPSAGTWSWPPRV